ncbi:hypothetical protein ABPG74_009171 [Tetrahymena malaccensis]
MKQALNMSITIQEFEKKHTKSMPIAYMLVSSLFFVIVSKIVRLLHGFGSTQIFFFRSIITLSINTIVISIMRDNPYTNDKAIHKLLIFRCLIAGIGHYSFYQAMYMLDITESITIFQTSPFWVTILAGIILKEKIKANMFYTLIFSFLGILFIIQPPFVKNILGINYVQIERDQSERMLGFFFACLQSFMIAFSMVVLKKLSSGVSNLIIIHYALISCCFIGGLDLINKAEFNSAIFLPQTFVLVVLVAIFNYFAQLLYCRAIMLGEASKLAPYTYSTIVFGFIIEILIFHKETNLLSILGSSLIIFGNIYSYNKNKT